MRGYSRQTETYASSLSNSGDNSEAEEDDDEDDEDDLDEDDDYYDERDEYDGKADRDGYGAGDVEDMLFDRPGSRAMSLPAKMGLSETDLNVTC